MTEARLSVPAQLAIGAALGVAVTAIWVAAGFLGVPVGTIGWVIVFLSVWAAVFISMKLRMIAMVVAFMMVEFCLYFALAARDFRLW